MSKTPPVFQWRLWNLLLPILLSHFSHSSLPEVGTASQYSPPYIPTECYGTDSLQFPSSNLFAAAGDGIWHNGASCGRQYMVRCISASTPGTCISEQTILITIVDYAATVASSPSAPGTTVVLSQTAFGTIANSTASSINIEFQQWTSPDKLHTESESDSQGKLNYKIPALISGALVLVGTLSTAFWWFINGGGSINCCNGKNNNS